MAALFLSALRAAIHGSVLGALVFIVLSLVPRLRPATRCWLWWLVLAKFSLGWVILYPVRILPPSPISQTAFGLTSAPPIHVMSGFTGGPNGSEQVSCWWVAVLIVWLLGVAVGVVTFLAGALRMARIYRAATSAPNEVEALTRRLSAEIGLNAPPKVVVSQEIDSPAAFGFFSSVVLLPANFAAMGGEELEMILTHELAHVARRDGLLSLVPELATILYWFFPPIYWARREWKIERELACDACVLDTGPHDRKTYRRLLLRMVAGDAKRLPRTALGSTTDFQCLKRRLTCLTFDTQTRTGSVWLGAFALLSLPISFQAKGHSNGLLQNAGFEVGANGPDGWTAGERLDGVKYLWDGTTAHTGSHSISIKKWANRYFPIAQWSQRIPYDGKSKAIEFTGWLKAEKTYKAVLDVQFATSEGLASHQWVAFCGAKNDGDPPVTHDWKPVGGIAQIPPRTTEIILAFQEYGPGQTWLDDVSARFLKTTGANR